VNGVQIEEYIEDPETGYVYAVDTSGDVLGVAQDGRLVDESGTWYEVDGSGTLFYADPEAEPEDAAFEQLVESVKALDGSLPRRLTSKELAGIGATAERLGTVDAKQAYERWREEQGRPDPKAEDEEQRLEQLAERYDDLVAENREANPEAAAAADAARATTGPASDGES